MADPDSDVNVAVHTFIGLVQSTLKIISSEINRRRFYCCQCFSSECERVFIPQSAPGHQPHALRGFCVGFKILLDSHTNVTNYRASRTSFVRGLLNYKAPSKRDSNPQWRVMSTLLNHQLFEFAVRAFQDTFLNSCGTRTRVSLVRNQVLSGRANGFYGFAVCVFQF